jgi:hypothetical protein
VKVFERSALSSKLGASSVSEGRLVFVSGEAGSCASTPARRVGRGTRASVPWGAGEPLPTPRPLRPLSVSLPEQRAESLGTLLLVAGAAARIARASGLPS